MAATSISEINPIHNFNKKTNEHFPNGYRTFFEIEDLFTEISNLDQVKLESYDETKIVLNTDSFNTKVDQCFPSEIATRLKNITNYIRDNMIILSKKEFCEEMIKLINNIIDIIEIRKDNYTYIILYMDIFDKSNTWLSFAFLYQLSLRPGLFEELKEKIILFTNELEYKKNVHPDILFEHKNLVIIMDDGSYSGTQLTNNIISFDKDTTDVISGVCMLGNVALNKLNNDLTEHKIITIEEYDKDEHPKYLIIYRNYYDSSDFDRIITENDISINANNYLKNTFYLYTEMLSLFFSMHKLPDDLSIPYKLLVTNNFYITEGTYNFSYTNEDKTKNIIPHHFTDTGDFKCIGNLDDISIIKKYPKWYKNIGEFIVNYFESKKESKYYNKYLKYKQKYINLKNKL